MHNRERVALEEKRAAVANQQASS
eukprot:COSAG02_NODE_61851_length_267_cov_0.922619_1_plen_23_part_01